MKYISTRGTAPALDFGQAMMSGLARDGGLYLPETIPAMPAGEIAALYKQLRAEAEKRLDVRVVSAVPLDEAQAERMKAALARRFEREISLHNEIDPEVLGGAVIYAGDQVIDGSLKGRLNRLQASLV